MLIFRKTLFQNYLDTVLFVGFRIRMYALQKNYCVCQDFEGNLVKFNIWFLARYRIYSYSASRTTQPLCTRPLSL